MAEQLLLVKANEFGGGVASLDLLSLFQMAEVSWEQGIASPGDEGVEEVITFHIPGVSHNDLASIVQNLDDFTEQASRHENPVERYSLWLRAKMDGETGERQAFIKKIKRDKVRVRSVFARHEYILPHVTLSLERMPYWERMDGIQLNDSPNISPAGGSWSYGTIAGDVPARINLIYFGTKNVGIPIFNDVWCGFRTARFGTLANFVPVWNCELGILENSTTSIAGGSNDLGAAFARCTFGDTSLLPRVTLETATVTANYADQRGIYQVLLRARVGSGTVCRVRLLDGYNLDLGYSAFRVRNRVVVDRGDSAWDLYELGSVQIPSPGRALHPGQEGSYGLRLEAERVSGTGNLEMDAFILIPEAEGFVGVKEARILTTSGRRAAVFETGDGHVYGLSTLGTTYIYRNIPAFIREGLPVGAGTLYVAARGDANGNSLSDDMYVRMNYTTRWITLRGSES